MSISDKISEVLAANPGYSWNDLVMRSLRTALSDTKGAMPDLWMRWLAGQGFTTGSLQDRMKTYWDANSVPLNERNAFYLGVRAFFSVEPSLVTNGNFATDTAWVKGTGWTISGGVANYTGLGGSNLSQAIAITSGVSYSVTYTVTLSAGEFIDVVLGGTVGTRRSASGTYSEQIVAGAANNSIRFSSPGSATGLTIDNVSVQLPAANDGWFFNTPDASGHLLTSGII